MARKPKAAKYPTLRARLTGEAATGKTTLIMAIIKELAGENGVAYIWNTDSREEEYVWGLGEDNILMPVADPLDTRAVNAEIMEDFAKGVLKNVKVMALDNLTYIFKKALTEGGQLALNKSKTMMNVRVALAQFNVPVIAVSHIEIVGTKDNLKATVAKDTVSDKEKNKMANIFNMDMHTVEKDGIYGVVIDRCRYFPRMKPLVIWDKEGTMFEGFYSKIMKAVFGADGMTQEEAEKIDPKFTDYGKGNPFPSVEYAVRFGAEYYAENKETGVKYFAFGDPHEEVTKKNGDDGENGAYKHAQYAYNKVKETVVIPVVKAEGIKGNYAAELMAEKWVQDVCRRIQEKISASKAAKELQAASALPPPPQSNNEELPF